MKFSLFEKSFCKFLQLLIGPFHDYVFLPSHWSEELFAAPMHKVAAAMDEINDRWGEFVVTPALMLGMDGIILDRISFGGVIVGQFHGRMPVILHKEDEAAWLNPDTAELKELLSLLKPYPADRMEEWHVGDDARNPRNDYPELIKPVN